MEFKGTKGEWWACCSGEGQRSHFVFGKHSEKTICAMRSNDPNEEGYESMEEDLSKEERQANAKLIASAPELLSALQLFIDPLTGLMLDSVANIMGTEQSNQIEQAVEKAVL